MKGPARSIARPSLQRLLGGHMRTGIGGVRNFSSSKFTTNNFSTAAAAANASTGTSASVTNSVTDSAQKTEQEVKDFGHRFRRDGVATLPLNADKELLQSTRKIVDHAFADALRRGDVIRNKGKGKHNGAITKENAHKDFTHIPVGQKHGYTELIQRAVGRYDMLWKVNGNPEMLTFVNNFTPFVNELMGEGTWRIEFNGALFSLPGAKEQLWHVDGEHLFHKETKESKLLWTRDGGVQNLSAGISSKKKFEGENSLETEKENFILPTHCFNVFIPLVDVEANNGGTEFCLGSHFDTAPFSDDIVWQRDDWDQVINFEGNRKRIQVNAGEVLAFDYRTLHRALDHKGQFARPILYYTFVKNWFSDVLNFADLPSLHLASEKYGYPKEPVKIGEEKVYDFGNMRQPEEVPASNQVPAGSSALGNETGATNTISSESTKANDFAHQQVRPNFPILQKPEILSGTVTFCDGAAGTQTPRVVAESMSDYMLNTGATNVGGNYETSERAKDTVWRARQSAAKMLFHNRYEMARRREAGGNVPPPPAPNGNSNVPPPPAPAPSDGNAVTPPPPMPETEFLEGSIVFGLNCTNLLFHVSRALTTSKFLKPGDNIVLSKACHDANIAPWVHAAKENSDEAEPESAMASSQLLESVFRGTGLFDEVEIRWLECGGVAGAQITDGKDADSASGADSTSDKDATADILQTASLEKLIDSKTKLVALGMASNATGRIHPVKEMVQKIRSIQAERAAKKNDSSSRLDDEDDDEDENDPTKWSKHALVVLDATHYIPHKPVDLTDLGADMVACSAYKFFGPHVGMLAMNPYGRNAEVISHLKPVKVGTRMAEDILPAGAPGYGNCQISKWEMGTLNYEGLCGVTGCVDGYFEKLGADWKNSNNSASAAGSSASAAGGSLDSPLSHAYSFIDTHEQELSQRMLDGLAPLLNASSASSANSNDSTKKLRLHGSRQTSDRTPTFALSVQTGSTLEESEAETERFLDYLNTSGICCTIGHHYAPELVEGAMDVKFGVIRVSLLHYSSLEDVDRVVRLVKAYFE